MNFVRAPHCYRMQALLPLLAAPAKSNGLPILRITPVESGFYEI